MSNQSDLSWVADSSLTAEQWLERMSDSLRQRLRRASGVLIHEPDTSGVIPLVIVKERTYGE